MTLKNYLLYGSNNLSKANRIQLLERGSLIIFACFIFLFAMFMVLFYYSMDGSSLNKYNTTVTYDGLSDKEIKNVKMILDDLKPNYFHISKSFIFTNNLSRYPGFIKRDDISILAGVNKDKNIVILYSDNIYELERTVMHEICHSLVKQSQESEYFCYDMENYYLAYKNKVEVVFDGRD